MNPIYLRTIQGKMRRPSEEMMLMRTTRVILVLVQGQVMLHDQVKLLFQDSVQYQVKLLDQARLPWEKQ